MDAKRPWMLLALVLVAILMAGIVVTGAVSASSQVDSRTRLSQGPTPPPGYVTISEPVMPPDVTLTTPITLTGSTSMAMPILVKAESIDGQPVLQIAPVSGMMGGPWAGSWQPVFSGSYRLTVLAAGPTGVITDSVDVTVTVTDGFADLDLAPAEGVKVLPMWQPEMAALVLPVIDSACLEFSEPPSGSQDVMDRCEELSGVYPAGTTFAMQFGGHASPVVVFTAGGIDEPWSHDPGTETVAITATSVAQVRASDGKVFTSTLAHVVSYDAALSDLQGSHFATNARREDIGVPEPPFELRGGMVLTGTVGSGGHFEAIIPESVWSGWGVADPERQITGYLEGQEIEASVTLVAGSAVHVAFDLIFGGLEGAQLLDAPVLTAHRVEAGARSEPAVLIAGPTSGEVGQTYAFSVAIVPVTATLPLTYTWEATDLLPVVHASVERLTDTVSLTWDVAGSKAITLTVTGSDMDAVGTHAIVLADEEHVLFLPLVIR